MGKTEREILPSFIALPKTNARSVSNPPLRYPNIRRLCFLRKESGKVSKEEEEEEKEEEKAGTDDDMTYHVILCLSARFGANEEENISFFRLYKSESCSPSFMQLRFLGGKGAILGPFTSPLCPVFAATPDRRF